MTQRRRFIATAGGVVAAAVAAVMVDAPNVIAQPKFQWRMSTAFGPALDWHQGVAERLAKVVEETSGGRFRIEVFPAGQLMEAFECFAAASQGKVEGFMGNSYYWDQSKRMPPGHVPEPAVEWFTTIPFGMNVEGMTAWFHQGDGLKLWEDTYAPFNLIPRPGPGVAPQMAGWFRKKTGVIGDYKGLRMRIGTGLGGKVYARAGATPALTPGSDIYAELERGVIDAAEVGPHDDMKLGLHKTAPYYYYPGWHEPGTMTEFAFNRKTYEALPAELRRTLDHAAAAVEVYGLTDYHAKNATALERLKTDFKGKVEIIQLSARLLRDLKKLATEVIKEGSEKTPMARKVHASFAKFQALVGPWDEVAEGAYHRLVAG